MIEKIPEGAVYVAGLSCFGLFMVVAIACGIICAVIGYWIIRWSGDKDAAEAFALPIFVTCGFIVGIPAGVISAYLFYDVVLGILI